MDSQKDRNEEFIVTFFFSLPANRPFRWGRRWWRKVGQNLAKDHLENAARFDTVTRVAIRRKDLIA